MSLLWGRIIRIDGVNITIQIGNQDVELSELVGQPVRIDYGTHMSQSSILAKRAPKGFDAPPVTEEFITSNRQYNYSNYKQHHLPTVKYVLVVGAGSSLTPEKLNEIPLDNYDAILLTFPIVDILSHLQDRKNVYVVDGEYFNLGDHFYKPEDTRLICRRGKDLGAEKFKSTTFFHSKNLPKSTGAIALKVALEYMGGTEVEYIGIDNTGDCLKYKKETDEILEMHSESVRNLVVLP